MTDKQLAALIAAIIRETHGGYNIKEAVEAAKEYIKQADA